jgi:putative ABC transport system permease protein
LSSSPFLQPVDIEKIVQDPNAPKPDVDVTVVSEDAFKTMGIPMLRGRDFSQSDTAEKPGTAIVSAATAKRYWDREDPIGQRISLDRGKTWLTIVGVAGDVKFFGLDKDALDEVYLYSGQNPGGGGNILVRTNLDAASIGQTVTTAVHGLDPQQPVTDIITLAQVRDGSLAGAKVTSLLLGGFAGLALLLAATGLFAVISFLVGQRTREIGIRIALGARAGSVLMMILSQGMRIVLVGLAAGIFSALFATTLVKSLLFGVTTTDWLTYSGVCLALVLTAVLATYFPARRASRVDPMVALRYE